GIERDRRVAVLDLARLARADGGQVLVGEDAPVAVLPIGAEPVPADVVEAGEVVTGRRAEHGQRAPLRLLLLFGPVHTRLATRRARAEVAQHLDGDLRPVA